MRWDFSWMDVERKVKSEEVEIEWMENEKNGKLRKIILIKSRKEEWIEIDDFFSGLCRLMRGWLVG